MSERENDQTTGGLGSLSIPLDSKVLGEFIAGLLGQSRLMERRFADRRFVIDSNWLLNLDQIIDQRLAAQNQAKLVSFSARFYFANGKTITLEDDAAFRAFHDMSNELSVGVDLRWSYLIKFPQASLPEKQEIRFSAFTDEDVAQQKPKEKKEEKSLLSLANRDGVISIAIRFTDVTWGEDIYAHMSNYIVAKTESIPASTRFVRRFKSVLVFPSAVLVGMIVAFWSIYSSTNSALASLEQKFGALDIPKIRTLDEKLDIVLGLLLARRHIDVFPFFPLLRGAIFLLVITTLYFLFSMSKASFININSYSDQHLRRYSQKYDFVKYGVFAALIVGIIGGVFSNRLYDIVKVWL